ncbi:uncharacterized protein LOC108719763 [Xenopus laevis]|uniref:Uncharacterized protein LOC108719763 n=1 Tax=Xenopus laevis TaxID=8355 RepID=A0A8J1L278_XENLA|nr:uncharacterized protein LOC108719763 [Xenopus laevis]
MESILPNFITSAEDMEIIMDVPKELWTINDLQRQESDRAEQYLSPTINPMWISSKQHDFPKKTSQDITKKEQEVQPSDLHPWTSEPPLKGQSSILTKFPSWQQGFALKGDDAVPTKTHQSVDIFLPKGQHQSSDTIPLFPLNVLKGHNISFSIQKTKDAYPLKLLGWTSLVPLEMLERPFTMIPLWTELHSETSTFKRVSASRVDSSNIQEDTISEMSSLIEYNKSLRIPSLPPLMIATVVKTITPLIHGTSSVLMPTISKSVILGKEERSTKTFSWTSSATRRKHEMPSVIQSSSIPMLSETLLPQVQSVSVDGHKALLSAHMQSTLKQKCLAKICNSIKIPEEIIGDERT